MQIDHPKAKCENPHCECEVEAGQPYCSEHCRSAAEIASSAGDEAVLGGSCNCGHAECTEGK